MRKCWTLAVLWMLSSCALSAPVAAGIRPYVRFDYGGDEFKLNEIDANITRDQQALNDAGYAVKLHRIGSGYGPGGSAGLWLFPGLRIGATYAYTKAHMENRVHVPGSLFYDDEFEFRVLEFGGEAVLRSERLGGLSVGGSYAQGRAQFVEGYTVEDASGQSFTDVSGEQRKPTYAAFAGFDQSTTRGVAGFVRVGYAFRDMGSLPAHGTISDGVNYVAVSGPTVRMDFSGWFVRCGMGFELPH